MISRSIIVETTVDIVVRSAMVFAFFLLFRGHNAPGGGFVAGLVVGISLVIRMVARGRPGVLSALPTAPETLMGLGLTVALAVAAEGWLWGEDFLQSIIVDVSLPLVGTLHVASALFFDVGVFLVVIGLTAALILTLGEEEPS